MNFLAHLYLSENNPRIMVGNFLGDFVRGRNLVDRFEKEVLLGIELHRNIDVFTDTHPIVSESKARLRNKYRHFSPVIVDIFYDHLLAKYWVNYHHQPLTEFAKDAYQIISSFESILPNDAKHMLPYMIKGNWLVNYATVEGIQSALSGMAKRTKFDSKMNESTQELLIHYEDFKNEFELFFPELKKFSKTIIDSKRVADL